MQSVFLGDIAAAYEKDAALESLLFDDFFNKGELVYAITIYASTTNICR